MVSRNLNFEKLKAGYLFPEIANRKNAILKENKDLSLISLGIGDTTEPLPSYVSSKMQQACEEMSTKKGYHGYGPEQGYLNLREKIARVLYQDLIHPDEVFVSDGAKCDIGRLQLLFGPNATIAVQDPAYPVYVDGSVIMGQTKNFSKGLYEGIEYMPCTLENDFFPRLDQLQPTDLIYFCSPNNPTGATATKDQLKELIAFAKKNKSIIIYDSAYASFIQDSNLPKSIYEIEGAKEVAIEVSSFSKMVGFTGVRLGWTIVPKELKFDSNDLVISDFKRLFCTIFNGASYISQKGGIAALDPEGMNEMNKLIQYYLTNAKILKRTLLNLGYKVFSGDNAPYLWTYFGENDSWEYFEKILHKTHIITTPGVGFGPSGQGFVRFSAFGHRDQINEAADRLKKL